MRTETTKDTKHTKPKGTRNRFLRTSCVSWFGNFLALVIVGFSCAAQAATGTSAEFEVDLRDGIRQSAGDETLTYSSLWDGDANATVTIAQDGVAIAEGLTGEGDRAWCVTRNGTYVLTHTTYTNGVAGKVETATFVVTGKDVPFAPGDVMVTSYSNKYDGAAHGIEVQSEIAGFRVLYGLAPDSEFSAEAPTLTDVGGMTVWVEISAPGYITETNSATVTITKREVTLTSGSDSKVYDGAALVKHEVAISGDGFADGEGAVATYTGSQTDVGESANTFTYTLNDGTKADNYMITTANGTLTVTKAAVAPGSGTGGGTEEPGGGVVPEGGLSKFDTTTVYDGEGHMIDTNAIAAMFGTAMIGGASVEYSFDNGAGAPVLPWTALAPAFTNAGVYVMWYRVTNPNYDDFVHEAKVTISNRLVTVTSADGEWAYDGHVHSNTTVTCEGFVAGEGIVASDFAEIENVGMVANAFNYAFADGTLAENYAVTCVTGTLMVAAADVGGWTDDAKWSVTLSGDGAMYDGTEKTCEVAAIAYDGFAIPTFTVSGNVATDAGSYMLTVTGTGNFKGSHSFPWSVAMREVSFTSGSDSKIYDGTPLRCDTLVVGGDGFASGEGAAYTFIGSQTEVGTCDNAFTYTLNVNTKVGNYVITTANGTLTVTKAENAWITEPSISGWTYGQAANAPNMGTAKFGTVSVSYSTSPQNAGSYTATFSVAGTENYSGLSKSVQFIIAKATYDMSGARWSVSSFTYNGAEKSVIIEGLPSGVTVASYSGNSATAAGNYTAHATLSYDTVNYNAPSIADCNWSIARKNIAGATVMLGPTLVYTGSPLTQAVTGVKVDGLDATYIVSGNTATDVATYTLTVTGTGNFTGTAAAQWQIRPDGIIEQVTPYDDIYDGVGHGISVSVTKPDGAVVKYAYAADGPYAEEEILFTNVTAAAVTVWYTVTAANYTTVTNSSTVKIAPKTLTDTMVTVEDAAYAYDGTAKAPSVTVTDGEPSILTADDYEVAYSDNINAGEATVTVTGNGNYTGTVTKHFNIAKAEVTAPTVVSKVYTGELQRANLSSTARYTVQNDGGVAAGNYPVTLTLTDTTNYRWEGGDSNPLSMTFTITKATNAWITEPSIGGWTYGQAVSVPNMGAARFGTAQVTYSATPQNAGSYTATFTVAETANYAGLTKSVPFVIAKAIYDLSGVRWSGSSFIYDGTEKSVIVEGLPSGVTVASYANNAKTAAGSYTARATLVYDTVNYNAPSIADCNWSIAPKNIAGATVTLGPTLTYSGAEQTQAVTGVKIDGLNATYTVSGNKATAAGTYTLTVTGTGNFTGTATVQWRVLPDGIVQQVTPHDGIYDGEGHGIIVTVTKPTDATVKYAYAEQGPYSEDEILFTNVTETAVTVWYIVEAENYTTVTNSSAVKISPKTLTDAMVAVADSSYTYDGTAKKPLVTVTDGEPSVLTDADYGVAYSGNVGAGEATVTVTGKGNYTGTVMKHFDISKATYDMSGATWSYSSPFTYDGQAHSVTLSGLPSGVTVKSYSNNSKTAAGSYTATATFNYDSTNFEAPSVPGCAWSISRRDIADATVALGAALTYNGQSQSQSVSGVTAGGLAVTYTVSGNTATDAGNYMLTVTGTGNFTGTATKQFTIARKSIAGATVTLGVPLTYTGSAQSQSVSSAMIGGLNATYTVSDNVATDAGTYTLTVTGTGNFTGSTMKQFTVVPKPITTVMVGAVGNVTYTGSAFTPEPVVTDSSRGVTLAKGTDYTLSYANNKDAGTATVTVTGQGNYSGAISKNFTIAKQTVVPPTIASKAYNGELQTATVASSTLYDIVQNTGGVDVGQYDVKLRLVDFANYAWSDVTAADLTLKFAITKASNAWISEPSIVGWAYGQAASVPNMGMAKFGTATVAYGALGSSRPASAGDYTATFTVAGTDNYSGLTKTIPFTIAKATYDMSGAQWDYAGYFTYDGAVKTVIVSGLPLGITGTSYTGNTATAPGVYTAHVVFVYDEVNFNEPVLADLVWEIKSAEEEALGEVFEGLPVLVEPDGEGGWKVTLTNDLDLSEGPLEIPDDLGHVTIDLGGHDLIGADGADGDDSTPEGAGKPAIRIVPGLGDGDATRLSLVTTGGDVLVQGGDGGAGNPGGDGASAIEVADGAKPGVKVDIGSGVTVLGGTGGEAVGEGASHGEDAPAIVGGTVGSVDGTLVKVVVPVPSIEGKEYTGLLQTAAVPTSQRYNVMQNAGGVDVGQYDVKLQLADPSNYAWPDVTGGDLTLKFSITKATNAWITEPSIAGWTYGQAAATPDMGTAKFGSATVAYGALVTTRPANAGNYTATFTVAETANYTGLTKAVPFTIAKATYDMSGARWDYADAFSYDGGVKTVAVLGLPLGVTVASYSGNTASVPGTYTAHAVLAYDDVNFNEPVLADLVWEIKSAEEEALGEVFEGLPVLVEPDGEGGWKVTLTNDLGLSEGPLEISDALGHVTIDLGGHDLIGADGADGDDSTPGGDGRPTIRIISGSGEGDATQLSIVTTGGDAFVQGGAGGVGNPSGDGAPAIEVADGAKPGVKVNIGAGVTVQGGAGGEAVGEGASPGEDTPAIVGGTVGSVDGTLVKVKVPVPDVPSAEYTGEAIEPSVPESPLYAVSASGGTRPGAYPVMLTLLDTANYEWVSRDGATVNGALAVVDFVIFDPPPRIETSGGDRSGRENAASIEATYDGAGHGISVTVTYPASGAMIRYALAGTGPFTDVKPLFTNVVDAAETWYELSAEGFESVTNMATVTVAPRSLAKTTIGSIRFEEVGGVRTPVPTLVDDLGHEIPSADYSLTWVEEESGAMTLTFTGRGNYLGMCEVKLAQTRFRVGFDANGGVLDVESADYDIGTYYGVLPTPTRAGYLFDGWYESLDFAPEHAVTRNTEVIAQDITLHAKWLRRALWYTDEVFHLEEAAQYGGYIIDPAADDVIAGTVQVKAGKPGKDGMSKITITVLIAGEKKATLKTKTFDGKVTGRVGGRELSLTLGASALSGTFGRYVIDGARNVFVAKDVDSRLRAAQALKRWQGTYVVAWRGDAGWNGLSMEVKAKGAAKVAGTLADGAKVSASSQLLVGERECALAVSWKKKTASVACLVWFREDGTVECGNLPGGASVQIANARGGASLMSGAAFRIDPSAVAVVIPGLLTDLLPNGQNVRMKGTAFDIAKPGKVGLLKDKSGVDLTKAGTNPSGLNLKYTVKNGTFKGSFIAYALSGGKLKKVKMSVSGVVLNSKGYGATSVKKVGSWPITIE